MKTVRIQHPDFPQIHYGRILDTYPARVEILEQAPWHKPDQISTAAVPLSEVQLLPPCQPSKIIGVGKNYRDHVKEMAGVTGDGSIPQEPLLFFKPPSALMGSELPIRLPKISEQVDFEGELALVIGQRCQSISPDAAQGVIAGYTIANDVTARDLQRQDSQWVRAKGFDTFCPLGPWLVTELPDQAKLETTLNDQIKQSATVDQMVFSIPILVSYITQVMTLEPGDLILTGTPSGVAPLTAGDRISVEIEGIGKLENPVTRAG